MVLKCLPMDEKKSLPRKGGEPLTGGQESAQQDLRSPLTEDANLQADRDRTAGGQNEDCSILQKGGAYVAILFKCRTNVLKDQQRP